MITKNFKQIMKCILQSTPNSTPYGWLPVKNVNNNIYYCSSYFNSYPRSPNETFTLSATTVGFSVGSGDTAATEDDYQLENTITSGLTAQVNRVAEFDNTGNPFLRYDIMLTNNTASDITVREIGYKQNIACSDTQGGTGTTNRVCLIDRTVLAEDVVIAASGGYQVIRYTLKTVIGAGE